MANKCNFLLPVHGHEIVITEHSRRQTLPSKREQEMFYKSHILFRLSYFKPSQMWQKLLSMDLTPIKRFLNKVIEAKMHAVVRDLWIYIPLLH